MTPRVLAALVPAVLVSLASLSRGQGLPPPPPPPLGNPITFPKTMLGKTLFWDEQVSSSGTVACGSCHVPARGGSDPRSAVLNPASRHPGFDALFGTPDDVTGSGGVTRQLAGGSYLLDPAFRLAPQVTGRKSPTFLNSAFLPLAFWDGRADGSFEDPLTGAVVLPNGAALESQSVGPPVSDVEMGHVGRDWNDVVSKVALAAPLRLAPSVSPDLATWIAGRSYPQLFQEAFGAPDVTPSRIAMAIATYERTLITNQAPIDAFLGGNGTALTPQEVQGRNLFNGIGRCNTCHAGPLFTNNSFQYIGVRPQLEDLGRFGVTGNIGDRGRMKTPSLRNVELRGPWFHNGEMATLEDVVDFYDRGGDFDAPNKAPQIAPIGLTPTQKAALVAFLKRPLTDPRVAAEQPPFDHPTLYAVSPSVPAHFGTGTGGTGGFVPVAVALEPPVIGNARMTIAIDRARGGMPAMLALDPVSVPGGTPFQGATLYLGLSPNLVVRRVASLQGSGPGEGWGSVSLSIPNDPILIGTTVHAQWLVFDPVPGRRVSASDAVAITRF